MRCQACCSVLCSVIGRARLLAALDEDVLHDVVGRTWSGRRTRPLRSSAASDAADGFTTTGIGFRQEAPAAEVVLDRLDRISEASARTSAANVASDALATRSATSGFEASTSAAFGLDRVAEVGRDGAGADHHERVGEGDQAGERLGLPVLTLLRLAHGLEQRVVGEDLGRRRAARRTAGGSCATSVVERRLAVEVDLLCRPRRVHDR